MYKNEELQKLLRKLYEANYPPTLEVTMEELCLAEDVILERLKKEGKPTIIAVEDKGVWFKGVQLHLRDNNVD